MPAARSKKSLTGCRSPRKVLKVGNNVDNTNIISELSKPIPVSNISQWRSGSQRHGAAEPAEQPQSDLPQAY
ncbi:unnamed protein product [Cylicocyclus nassatus]|uniref:Uncharacterized protein n=1 Tax=Cylicocyclus nassatus TaxID=53992 RepID=A0AA36M5P8_CYLNA|nr:unnamed protein product [Cylicocyclus nassatus]